MISDLTLADSSNYLQEYYDRLYNLQSKAHGSDYMLVHNEIKNRLKGCKSYTELGVNQGATLAVAILEKLETVRAYDIRLAPYNKAKFLFDNHAKKFNVNLEVYETDTLKCVINEVDVMYIDTLHSYDHLTNELKLHGHKAQKYIIFHDTFAKSGLKKAVKEYVQNNKEWNIITDCEKSVGFMTIVRKK